MEKDEILAKSRKEKQDEGVQYATTFSERMSLAAGMLVCAFFFVLSTIYSNEQIFYSTWFLYGVMLGVQKLALFKKLHKRFDLIAGILFLIISAAFVVKLIFSLGNPAWMTN